VVKCKYEDLSSTPVPPKKKEMIKYVFEKDTKGDPELVILTR
jgi:hypothetical protein